MDEILIGDKTYISSKRAAKITGYAKDYIGQLCREGRVPARLVGRGWYVLESAIQDHRFGSPVVVEEKEEKVSQNEEKIPESTQQKWESPRYEATEGEMLPSINRLRSDDILPELQDSWQAWFSRIAPTSEAPTQPVGVEIVGEELKEPKEAEDQVPIHSVYELPPQGVMPKQDDERDYSEELVNKTPAEVNRRRGNKMAIAAFKVVGAIIALISVTLAVVGSGYVDQYIISYKQVHIFAGVSLYNK